VRPRTVARHASSFSGVAIPDDLPRHGPGDLAREDGPAQARQLAERPPHAGPLADGPGADPDPLPAPVAEAAEAELLVGATLHQRLGQGAEARPHRGSRADELPQPPIGVATAQEDEGGPRGAANRRSARLESRRRHARMRTQRTCAHRRPRERWGESRSLDGESPKAV
jgi:hypothetical protein